MARLNIYSNYLNLLRGRRLEGYGETVNQLEGFVEEGAHRMELSTRT
jgi:hypothetical protein